MISCTGPDWECLKRGASWLYFLMISKLGVSSNHSMIWSAFISANQNTYPMYCKDRDWWCVSVKKTRLATSAVDIAESESPISRSIIKLRG